MNQTMTLDEFLEHHGVKGQKWGVRRAEKRAAKGPNRFGNRNTAQFQRRTDRVARVASGKASVGDQLKAGLFNVPLANIVAEGSLRGGSALTLERNARVQAKIVAGKKNATDTLLRLQGVDIRELDFSFDK